MTITKRMLEEEFCYVCKHYFSEISSGAWRKTSKGNVHVKCELMEIIEKLKKSLKEKNSKISRLKKEKSNL